MKKLKIYLADHFDPWFNLATENYIFQDMDPKTSVLFLWRNEKTIVIGRNQNPWAECHVQAMEADGIRLARRQSGGGAVYHDLGNTNFTFLSAAEGYDRDANSKIIVDAVKNLGVKIEATGRNDLVVPADPNIVGDLPKKVSGAAFKETSDRCFHHGTMLIDADLSQLAKYLNPSKKKLQAKGTKSVRSRVTNLVEHSKGISHESFVSAVIESFCSFHQSTALPELLSPEKLSSITEVHSYYQQQKDWGWRFGKSPKFQHLLETRFAWGEVQVHLDFQKGKIEHCRIFSDNLFPELIEYIANSLIGADYRKEEIRQVGKKLFGDLPRWQSEISEFFDWLVEEI